MSDKAPYFITSKGTIWQIKEIIPEMPIETLKVISNEYRSCFRVDVKYCLALNSRRIRDRLGID